jgi:hypothetical protein
MSGLPAVDLAALREEMARHEPPPGRRVHWAARQVAVLAGAFYLLAFAIPAAFTGTLRHLVSGHALSVDVGASLLFGAALAMWSLRASRGPFEARLERAVPRLERGWAQMTRGHWVLRVLLMGLALAAGIGFPVGVLIAATSRRSELVGGSRVLTVLVFLGLTLAWCIPMAFAIRWLYLRRWRRFIVAA